MSSQVKLQLPFEVAERLKQGEKFEILDVRESQEWEEGHIPEATHIPLGELEERHMELNKEQEMVVVCRSGNRSAGWHANIFRRWDTKSSICLVECPHGKEM
ncbi:MULTISPECIES: rhodanese-like domain-containing protein [unclassified Paenibacillus]|uniref:rhodanese-like domain-containing protein n=1 Tax=unclassified Paenibacillus TaxID=185978 RepID=UPI003629FB1A